MDLCFADLWHYHDMEVSMRSERLREQLHVSVSAAVVTADGGETFRKMDDSLAPKGPPVSRIEDEEPTPGRTMKADEIAFADATADAVMQMWR